MTVGVVVFPGSNCDHDAYFALQNSLEIEARFVWHDSPTLGDVDAVILPGGFSYGDYLRTGAIAKFSPVMGAVKRFAESGGPVLGICNGFQVLTEAGLLPGALVRNEGLKFVCRTVLVEVSSISSPFTQNLGKGETLRLPVAHGEGCYIADAETIHELEAEDRVVLRYRENPNGSMNNIAGIVNRERNVLGMMPHPERASDPLVGGTDGLAILQSLVSARNFSSPLVATSRS